MGCCDACLPCCKCLSGCGRVIIVLVNLPFIVLGLVLSVFAILTMTNDDLIRRFVNLNDLVSQMKDSLGIDIDLSSFNVAEILGGMATGLLIFGLILLVLTMMGCCGACYGVCIDSCSYLIIPYVVVLIILVLGQAVLWGLVLAQPRPFDNQLKDVLRGSLSEFQGIQGNNTMSLVWNAVMFSQKCCGVNDYRDFNTSAPQWVNPIYYDGQPIHLEGPVACCDGTPDDQLECAKVGGNGPNNRAKGCYDTVINNLLSEENRKIAYGILCGTLLPQIIIVALAIIILCMNKKGKVAPV